MISELSPGRLLGPYELLLPLPRTGAAQVWLARLVRAGGFRTQLALKAIPRAYIDDLPTEHLLLEQAALAARILHPNLVATLDLGEQDETLYLAMEWVDGEPLQRVFVEATKQGGMPWPIAVNIVGQLCRALHAIHEHRDGNGVPLAAVHGHVSLQNLMLAYNGTAKLCDFGIARAMDRLSFLTRANERNHKLTFAAPEQLNARPVDRRSDVFSAGTLLYMLTTSHHPFEGGDARTTLNNICSRQPALPPGPSYPNPLGEVLMKALRKAPDERFASALELGSALESAVPESFHTSSDQTLAAYLDELCSAHRREFHALIRAASAQPDTCRTSIPAGLANGAPHSLRAVVMDSIPDADSAPRRSRAGAALSRAASPLGVTLLSLFAVCLAIGFGLAAHAEKSPGPALASPASPPQSPLERPRVPREAAAAPPLATSTTRPIDISELPAEPIAATATARTRRISPFRRSAGHSAELRSGSAPPAGGSSASRIEHGSSSTQVNAWDPSTFGGRY